MYIRINDLSVTFSIICMLSRANYIIISPRISPSTHCFFFKVKLFPWHTFLVLETNNSTGESVIFMILWIQVCVAYWELLMVKTVSLVNFIFVRIRDSECDTQIKASYSWLLATHFIQTPQDIKEDQQEGCCMLKIVIHSALLKQHADVLWWTLGSKILWALWMCPFTQAA